MGVWSTPPTPFPAGNVIYLSPDTQYYVILMFRWTMIIKKTRRKRFIWFFSVLASLPLFTLSFHWFQDLLLGIPWKQLISVYWLCRRYYCLSQLKFRIFFSPVCLCFSISNLPSCLHFQSTWIFQLLWGQSKGIKGVQGSRLVVRGCSGSLVWHLSDGTSPAKGCSGIPLRHNPWGEGEKPPNLIIYRQNHLSMRQDLSPSTVGIGFGKTRMVL